MKPILKNRSGQSSWRALAWAMMKTPHWRARRPSPAAPRRGMSSAPVRGKPTGSTAATPPLETCNAPPRQVQGRGGLGRPAIAREPRLDRFRPIVGAVDEVGAAAHVAHPLDPRPPVALVKAGAAALAGEAPGDAVDQRGFIDLDQDHVVERLAPRAEHRVERLGLRHGARKAVEHEAASTVRLADPLRDHLDDDVARN